MKFGLEDRHWLLLEDFLIKPLKAQGATVWIFGSRATGSHQNYSDIDILYQSKSPMPQNFIGDISERLENSALPIKVDLVDQENLAEAYKKNVLSQRIEL